jgi:hypothetical protein
MPIEKGVVFVHFTAMVAVESMLANMDELVVPKSSGVALALQLVITLAFTLNVGGVKYENPPPLQLP